MQKIEWWLPRAGGTGELLLMGTAFQFGMDGEMAVQQREKCVNTIEMYT